MDRERHAMLAVLKRPGADRGQYRLQQGHLRQPPRRRLPDHMTAWRVCYDIDHLGKIQKVMLRDKEWAGHGQRVKG
jgi:hypothetical protein